MSSLDITDLRGFYASPLGQVTQRLLGQRVAEAWGGVVGCSILGLGYATPYLGAFRADAMRTLALMPAEQGVTRWPAGPEEPNSAALVDELDLPLPSSSVDRVLLVHLLEVTQHPAEVLREVWRVMESGARLLIIAPARRGWWSSAEWTPFGHGRPYSRGQLTALLRETQFATLGWSEALYLPPSNRATIVGSANAWERVGRKISWPFAGVHVVEAAKQVYSPIPARRVMKLAPRLSPVLVPSPVKGRAGERTRSEPDHA